MSKKPSPEDAFYNNLTLGLVKTLNKMPRVCNICCEKRPPCERAHILNWEQRHSVTLPDDMKRFYLSSDGFLLHWSYQYSNNDVRRVGFIQLPHLVQITLLRENIDALLSKQSDIPSTSTHDIQKSATSLKDQSESEEPILTPRSKIFELSNINDTAKVCLVYESMNSINPHIYLLEIASSRWHFLAESLSEYMRMGIGHLGLPYWELCFSSSGLPSWVEQLFLLLAPHLLHEKPPRRSRVINPVPEHPQNVVDSSIFRVKTKTSSKLTSAGKPK